MKKKNTPMDVTGEEGEFISLDTAAAWTANYRNRDAGETKAHLFGWVKMQEVLTQPGCVGVRIYYAIDDAGAKQLIVVGVDILGRDILINDKILDQSLPCPPGCDSSSALNG